MTFQPLLDLPPHIALHAGAAVLALALGPFVIHRRRRDRAHRVTGYIWVVAMATVALSAFAIPAHGLRLLGHLGPFHLFAVLALASLLRGMAAIWRRDAERHAAALRGLYWQGVAVAATLNFLPGRAVTRALFPDAPQAGLWVIALGAALLALVALRQRIRPQAAVPGAVSKTPLWPLHMAGRPR